MQTFYLNAQIKFNDIHYFKMQRNKANVNHKNNAEAQKSIIKFPSVANKKYVSRIWIELLYMYVFTAVNVYYLLTQRSGLKFIRFLFPLPLPRFEESTEGRKFTFSFQGRRSRTWTQTVCPQSSTILLFRCNEKKNNVIYNLLHIFFIYVEQIKFLFLLNWYSVIKLFKK